MTNWEPECCIYTRELLVPLLFQMGSTDVVHIIGMGLEYCNANLKLSGVYGLQNDTQQKCM